MIRGKFVVQFLAMFLAFTLTWENLGMAQYSQKEIEGFIDSVSSSLSRDPENLEYLRFWKTGIEIALEVLPSRVTQQPTSVVFPVMKALQTFYPIKKAFGKLLDSFSTPEGFSSRINLQVLNTIKSQLRYDLPWIEEQLKEAEAAQINHLLNLAAQGQTAQQKFHFYREVLKYDRQHLPTFDLALNLHREVLNNQLEWPERATQISLDEIALGDLAHAKVIILTGHLRIAEINFLSHHYSEAAISLARALGIGGDLWRRGLVLPPELLSRLTVLTGLRPYLYPFDAMTLDHLVGPYWNIPIFGLNIISLPPDTVWDLLSPPQYPVGTDHVPSTAAETATLSGSIMSLDHPAKKEEIEEEKSPHSPHLSSERLIDGLVYQFKEYLKDQRQNKILEASIKQMDDLLHSRSFNDFPAETYLLAAGRLRVLVAYFNLITVVENPSPVIGDVQICEKLADELLDIASQLGPKIYPYFYHFFRANAYIAFARLGRNTLENVKNLRNELNKFPSTKNYSHSHRRALLGVTASLHELRGTLAAAEENYSSALNHYDHSMRLLDHSATSRKVLAKKIAALKGMLEKEETKEPLP